MISPGDRVRACVLLLWLPMAAGAAEVRDNLYGVTTLSPTEAWSVGNFGAIHHTTDGGKNWQAANSGTKLPLFGVSFADGQRGWVVGKSGLILHTADGGTTWKSQESPIPPDKHLFKVKATDANTAWTVGDWGAIAMTRDGGQTWQDRSLGTITVREEEAPGRTTNVITDDVILYDVSFPDRTHGFICGEFGTVLATTDAGETWTRRVTPTEKTLFGLYFSTPSEGWAVGIDGLVMHTADGGKTWDVQHGDPVAAPVDEISFVESMKNPGMYAVQVAGQYGVIVGDVGMLLVSADGGKSWARRELPDKDRLVWLRDVSLVPGTSGFLVGGSGFSAYVARDQVTVPRTGQVAIATP